MPPRPMTWGEIYQANLARGYDPEYAAGGKAMTDNMWEHYKGDFNAMSDDEVDVSAQEAQAVVDEQQEWLDAVASWKAAGRPRTNQALTALAEADAPTEKNTGTG